MSYTISFDFDRLRDESLRKVGEMLVEQARDNMDDYSHGRTYIVNGHVHIVSVRGETANNLSGDLNDSIRYELDNGILKFGAGSSTVDYAGYLEEYHNRPNYMKSVDQCEARIRRVVGDRIDFAVFQVDNGRVDLRKNPSWQRLL